MILHDETDVGGSVNVTTKTKKCSVLYEWSNKTHPLSIWCKVSDGSDPKIASGILNTLEEKYQPTVLSVDSHNTAIKYSPKVGGLMRYWTQDDKSVYAKAFNYREIFERVCSLSYAMSKKDFIKVNGDTIDLIGYHAVLKAIRENTMPLAFLALKEECDYSMMDTSVNCVKRLLSCSEKNMKCLSETDRSRFEESVALIHTKQDAEAVYFDTKRSYLHEVVTSLLLPAIVKYGDSAAYPRLMINEFSSQISNYVDSSDRFMKEYDEVLNEDVDSND